jgi:hypothetical protein
MVAFTRRNLCFGAAIGALASALAAPVAAQDQISVIVHRDASCGCCGRWVKRLQEEGFQVEIINEPDMKAVKKRLGVPGALTACHTAEIGGYVIEGHTPVAAIKRLLQEKPRAIGLAVPGMPAGSPGMEMGGDPEVYEVVLFAADGQRGYGKFKGGEAA